MTEPNQPSGIFIYKLGFIASLVILWTLACMSTGFVIGTIFGRPAMRIDNYNADGFLAEMPSTDPVIVPEIKTPKHRRHR